ncbi:MAG: alpha/beta hydrolase fold domain-containing protein, partial [Myxococcales bacterium]|nr:alpha/beta hydrolase fold domain-containing protein [Myxococcales bacterium]
RILSKDTHYVMALAFARAGYLVVNVDYRLAPRDPYPAAVQDCAEAYGWVLDHVERHGGDPSRMAVAGESAGANLVSALVAMCCYPRPEPWAEAVFRRDAVPRAWLPYCGLLQVTDCERFRRNKPTLSTFINDRLMEVPHAYLGERPSIDTSLADPLLMFEQAEPIRPLPPCFATVGTADPLLDDTRRLGRALEARGSLAEVRFYPGEIHAFHAFVWRKAARRCWRDTYRFLDEHLPARGGHRAPNPVHPGA